MADLDQAPSPIPQPVPVTPSPRRRPWLRLGPLLGWTLLAWLAGVLGSWVVIGFDGDPVLLGVCALGWLAVLAAVLVLGVLARRAVLTVVLALVTVALAVGLTNWSTLAPTTYFRAHQSLFDRAVAQMDQFEREGGTDLPLSLRMLSATGRVEVVDTMLFFPQRRGFRTGMGGYLWSPTRSPEGADLAGLTCRHPRHLGRDWWSCGL
ncbi:hypothetical protein [Nocardioides sp.]|uniref:hypothetical protein n=1 Tax=Nocardioides sp. TaxID=35761 RepID=UPI00260E76A7|nr:hypothetical protein [Nocardioides sp.]